MPRVVYQNELYHHGILGQKWGVRRYQNEDGSYTDKGKKHRYEHEDLSNLSDQEVQQKLNRARNELQYHQTKRQLDREVSGKTEAEENTRRVVNNLKTVVAVSAAAITIAANGKKIVGGLSKFMNSTGVGVETAFNMYNNSKYIHI